MRLNSRMTDLCRATRCLSLIVLDSHRRFIDGVLVCLVIERSRFPLPGCYTGIKRLARLADTIRSVYGRARLHRPALIIR